MGQNASSRHATASLGVEASVSGAQVSQVPQDRRCHRHTPPVRGSGDQTGIEQGQARTLGRESRDDFRPPATFPVESLEPIRRTNALVVSLRKPQSGDALLEVEVPTPLCF